jgi:hypothetical protein
MASFEEEQAAIQRRQMIAQQLMAQGAEPMDTNQVAGGYVVPVSPLGALAKIGQQMSGAYIAKEADKSAADLNNKRFEELGGIDFDSPEAPSKLMKMGLIAEALKLKAGGHDKGHFSQGFQLGYDAQGNPFRFNKDSGIIGQAPNESGGLFEGGSALYTSKSVAEREQAKQGQKGVKVTDEQGREYYAPQAATNPQFKDYTQAPMIDISPDASPEDRAMLENIARQTGGQIQQAVKSQSPAEAAAAKVSAELPYKVQEAQIKAEINKNSDLETLAGKNQLEIQKTQDEKSAAIKYNAEQSAPLIDRAMALLPNTVSGGINAKLNDALEAMNYSTDRSKAKTELDAVATELTSKVPRAPGAQSDIELKYAQQQAGNLADSSKPWESRMAAAKYLKGRNEKILKGEEVKPPEDGAPEKRKTLRFDANGELIQ